MEKRTCTKCKKKKDLSPSYFHRDPKQKGGFKTACKVCKNKANKNFPSRIRGTIEYFKQKSWGKMNSRTINGRYPEFKNKRYKRYFEKGIKLKITKDAFYDFCEKHKKKILSIYKRGGTPSIDRINSNRHYEVGNLQIITLSENVSRAHKGRSKKRAK